MAKQKRFFVKESTGALEKRVRKYAVTYLEKLYQFIQNHLTDKEANLLKKRMMMYVLGNLFGGETPTEDEIGDTLYRNAFGKKTKTRVLKRAKSHFTSHYMAYLATGDRTKLPDAQEVLEPVIGKEKFDRGYDDMKGGKTYSQDELDDITQQRRDALASGRNIKDMGYGDDDFFDQSVRVYKDANKPTTVNRFPYWSQAPGLWIPDVLELISSTEIRAQDQDSKTHEKLLSYSRVRGGGVTDEEFESLSPDVKDFGQDLYELEQLQNKLGETVQDRENLADDLLVERINSASQHLENMFKDYAAAMALNKKKAADKEKQNISPEGSTTKLATASDGNMYFFTGKRWRMYNKPTSSKKGGNVGKFAPADIAKELNDRYFSKQDQQSTTEAHVKRLSQKLNKILENLDKIK